MKKLIDMLKDSHGKLSSKRVWGSLIMAAGFLLGVALFFYAIYTVIKSPETAENVVYLFLMIGGALLGFGVFERAFNKKNDK